MKNDIQKTSKETLGIIGFGAFGKLIAQSLKAYFEIFAYDPLPEPQAGATALGATFASLERVSQCDVVVIASPVSSFEDVVALVAKACRPGALIVDVGSVKVQPADIMARTLPEDVDVVATHPLFGPQSARDGFRGLKIALCPIRGACHWRLGAFLRKYLGLDVIMTTPHAHDREAATVQGLTHLIAKVLLSMGPLPSRMTTRSFDLLITSISMVQNDAPEVFDAIENLNPYAQDVRRQFFRLAHELSLDLEKSH
ncbi:prephenate dehydrogenase/arogenate dehydrogenase family protein [Roseobacter sp. EG26]|uniref:prephenate dehydrogenase/arogenate dehydrogenase family protein n=1 Tax=Roseobacter sp. EG26 TaxID=3412477 RepID=UPI003CE524CC